MKSTGRRILLTALTLAGFTGLGLGVASLTMGAASASTLTPTAKVAATMTPSATAACPNMSSSGSTSST
ncbi:MAG: hypothetical protein ACREOL_09905 [Candidatus Dormibacteria bacterium]